MQSVGVVAKISGKVFVKRNGKLILLKQGDEIFLGDEIVTQSSNDTIVINFDHAAPITLLEPQTIIITKELSNSIFDIIDSRNTRDASSSAASESVNAVLKVIGDSKDLVQLTHDFVKATKAEITTLNNKHSVVATHTTK